MTRPAQGQTSENNIQADVTKNNRFAVLDRNKSDLKFKIAAADDGRSGPTHLVYVGRLRKETSADDIREHLLHIRFINEDVADVIKLNCKNKQESSFCLSIHGEQAKSIVFSKNKWPEGVRICMFKTTSRRPRKYNQKNNNYDSLSSKRSSHNNMPDECKRLYKPYKNNRYTYHYGSSDQSYD